MFVQPFNPLRTFALLREEIVDGWDKYMWLGSTDHREMVTLRLAAHEQAMAEGYQSPYTNPEDYDANWRPIVKRKKFK